jgi:hypothetical protein
MPQKIIYIINPITGTRTKKDLHEFIENTTKEKGIPYHVFPSVASGYSSAWRGVGSSAHPDSEPAARARDCASIPLLALRAPILICN